MSTRRTFLGVVGLATTAPVYPDLRPIFDRVQRHRQVFGVREIRDGLAFHQMMNSLNAYEFARNEGPGTLHVVAVLYGPAIALALSDAMWNSYRIADALGARHEPVAKAVPGGGNPFLRADTTPTGDDPHDPGSRVRDASVTGLVRRGASLLVCDNALTDFALSLVTLGRALRPDATAATLRSALVPGATLVPAGVAALNDAQEARYTYVAAS